MSIKIPFKGIIRKVEAPVALRSGSYKQELVIEKPAYVDEFGETKGKANFYKCAWFKENEHDFPAFEKLHEKKAEVTAYLNGNEFTTDNGLAYALNLNIKKLKIID